MKWATRQPLVNGKRRARFACIRNTYGQLPYPCSTLADPPITVAEALAVDLDRDTTLCRKHRGQLTHLNVEGRVYWCPRCRQYWRYTQRAGGMYAPLRYRF